MGSLYADTERLSGWLPWYLTGEVEACLQCPQWWPVQASWWPFRFSVLNLFMHSCLREGCGDYVICMEDCEHVARTMQMWLLIKRLIEHENCVICTLVTIIPGLNSMFFNDFKIYDIKQWDELSDGGGGGGGGGGGEYYGKPRLMLWAMMSWLPALPNHQGPVSI